VLIFPLVYWFGRKANQSTAPRYLMLRKEGNEDYESTRLSKTALRPLQGHPAQSRGDGDL
jgi:hypothetical protein